MARTTSTKPAKAKSTSVATKQPRRLRQTRSKILKRNKKLTPPKKLPSAWSIFKVSSRHVWNHKKIFSKVLAVYVVFTFVLVTGLGITSDIGAARASVEDIVGGAFGHIAGVFTALSVAAGYNGPTSDVAATFQSVILVLVSLAVIWTLRQTHAREDVTLRDSFYRSMYPLIPFLIVLVVIGLQLLPILLGNFILSQVIAGGIATTSIEVWSCAIAVFLLYVWSIYMISASVFALFIVTLPDMTPLRALRSAKELVRYRRWAIIRKVCFLPVILLIGILVVMFPFILFAAIAAEPVFIILSSLMFIVTCSYAYSLYRELL